MKSVIISTIKKKLGYSDKSLKQQLSEAQSPLTQGPIVIDIDEYGGIGINEKKIKDSKISFGNDKHGKSFEAKVAPSILHMRKNNAPVHFALKGVPVTFDPFVYRDPIAFGTEINQLAEADSFANLNQARLEMVQKPKQGIKIRWWLVVFACVLIAVLFYFMVLNPEAFAGVVKSITSAARLTPTK